jgi:hypothetical protein
MNDDLESQLRAALRPVEPPEDLHRRVLARLEAARGQPRVARRFGVRHSAWWLSAGLAASLLIAFGLHSRIQHDRETAAGLEARREVIQALRLTHEKLDLAYHAVKEQAAASEGTS